MREKLIELLKEADRKAYEVAESRQLTHPFEVWEIQADHLIAQGVTVTDNNGKWISVKERLPEHGLPRFSEVKQIKVLTALRSDKGVITVRSQMRYKDSWCNEVRWRWKYSGSEITHWMPLPEPPKGE